MATSGRAMGSASHPRRSDRDRPGRRDLFARGDQVSGVRLIAHRGFALTFPENTLFAVRAAAEIADLVEVDVRRCGSGEPVVVHDETVDRVTDGTGRVADLSLAALRDLDVLNSGEPIPTLAEVAEAVSPDAGLVLDLKVAGTAADAIDTVRASDAEMLVSSFDADELAAARQVAPEVPRALLFRQNSATNLQKAGDLDCAAVHPHHEFCTSDFVRRAHVGGFSVHALAVEQNVDVKHILKADVDGIIIGYPIAETKES